VVAGNNNFVYLYIIILPQHEKNFTSTFIN
jgi:hypothetical protein